MAPPKNISPELNSMWLALRQKHHNESDNFQSMVAKNRAEFEARAARAKKDLLAKHISEESEFWSKHGQANPAKATSSSGKSARTPAPNSARSSATPARITATPAPRFPTPRMQLQRPVTPTRPSQQPLYPRVPPPPKKPSKKVGTIPAHKPNSPTPKSNRHEVIDLCSDDEEDVLVPEPVVQQKPTPKPAPQQLPTESPTAPDSMEVDQVHGSTPFSMPEASIELFGRSNSMRYPSTPVRAHIKDEIDSPGLASPFEEMLMSTPKEPNGLSRPELASPFSQRASTVAPQFGASGRFNLHTPPSTPDRDTFGGLGPNACSPSLDEVPSDNNASGTNISSTGFPDRQAMTVPPSSSSDFQSQKSSQPSSHTLEPEIHSPAECGGRGKSQPEHLAILNSTSIQDGSNHNGPQELEGNMTIENNDVDMQDSSPRAKDAFVTEGNQVSGKSSAAGVHVSLPLDSIDHDERPAVVARTGAGHSSEHVEAQQLPSPPLSHASVISKPAATAPSFKMPSLPASAVSSTIRQPVAPEARHVRAGSDDTRTSSFTFPASPRTSRGASVTSRTSDLSGRTGATHTQKRKLEIDLSSDEDEDPVSDYAPSEPDSPSDVQPIKQAKATHAVKKSKANDGSGVVIKAPAQAQKPTAKKGFEFRPISFPKQKLMTASAVRSGVPKKTFTSPSRPIVPKPKTKAIRASTKSLQKKSISQFSKRRAAVAAESKIQEILDYTEEFETECAIEEADHMETARLPDSMGRMSITPVPSETVDMLAEPESPKDFNNWTNTRRTGDRVQRRVQTESSDSEPDISEYISVDGIIIRKDQVKELDLTDEAQTTTSGVTGAGRQGGEGVGFLGRMKNMVRCRMS